MPVCQCVLAHTNGIRDACTKEVPPDTPFCSSCEGRHLDNPWVTAGGRVQVTVRPLR